MDTPRAVLSVKDGVVVIRFHSVQLYVEDDRGCGKFGDGDHLFRAYDPVLVTLEPGKNEQAVTTDKPTGGTPPREH